MTHESRAQTEQMRPSTCLSLSLSPSLALEATCSRLHFGTPLRLLLFLSQIKSRITTNEDDFSSLESTFHNNIY